ncbi:hypothetical protein G9C98_000819 [Cotesia typhae]|uniref:Uncharacterized protein n=1 Tax=Cotesia typhae TaxID=2053667 RepID=A0A8J5VC29_9HYME|nr:hypothetical protein G9C98_000819 [Cotesia typhae]
MAYTLISAVRPDISLSGGERFSMRCNIHRQRAAKNRKFISGLISDRGPVRRMPGDDVRGS